MNNKQVFLKPNVVFEPFAHNLYACGNLRFLESLLYECNFYKSISHPQDFDILSLKVSFGQPYSYGRLMTSYFFCLFPACSQVILTAHAGLVNDIALLKDL